MRLIILLLATASIFSYSALADTPTYFIWDGRQLTPAYTDPAEVNVTEWRIWLFKKNDEQRAGKQWGQLSASTAGKVQQKLLKAQNFEHRYERWCNCDFGSATYKNPSMPIAVVDEPAPSRSAAAATLAEQWDQISSMYDTFASAQELAGSASTPPASAIGEYMAKLKEAHETAAEIDRMLTSATGSALDSIRGHLDRLHQHIDSAQKAYQRSTSPSTNASQAWAALFIDHRETEPSLKNNEQTVEFIPGGVIIHHIFKSTHPKNHDQEYHTTIRFNQIARIELHLPYDETSTGWVELCPPRGEWFAEREVDTWGKTSHEETGCTNIYSYDPDHLRAAYAYFKQNAPAAKAE